MQQMEEESLLAVQGQLCGAGGNVRQLIAAVTQIPTLIIAYHSSGRFLKVEIRKVPVTSGCYSLKYCLHKEA